MLVSEDKNRHVLQLFVTKELIQVALDFFNTRLISRVDDVDEGIGILVVVWPVGANLTLTTDIPNVELEAILRLKEEKKERCSDWACLF